MVIAEDTRRLLGNLFELEDLGPKDLKGIAEPVRAWAALRTSSAEGRFEALHASGLTARVGREPRRRCAALRPRSPLPVPPWSSPRRKVECRLCARQSPVLITFEDAQWSDPTSLEVFGRVVERCRSLRVLLVVTFRPEFEPPSGPAEDVAQIGAAIGREFSFALLAAVVRKPETELNAALDRLTAAGLLSRHGLPPHASYVFKHALVQDAAYGTLLREPRRGLHAQIADAWGSIPGGRGRPTGATCAPLHGSRTNRKSELVIGCAPGETLQHVTRTSKLSRICGAALTSSTVSRETRQGTSSTSICNSRWDHASLPRRERRRTLLRPPSPARASYAKSSATGPSICTS